MRAAAGDLVSVIVPTFNRAAYVCEAIESVLSQSHRNLELHVVDDGSTDDTHARLQKFRKDDRVLLYRQPNSGQAVARNLGLQHARGAYVCFLDSDNVWFSDKLEHQCDLLSSRPEVDVVYGDLITIDEQGNEITHHNMPRHSGRITTRLLRENFVSFNTAMARRRALESVGGLNPEQRRADDYDLWLRVSVKHEFLYVPRFYAKYRVQADQISSNKEGRFEANREILERFFASADGEAFSSRARCETWAHFHTRRARYRSSAGDFRGALADIKAAAALRPASTVPIRTIMRLLLDAMNRAAVSDAR